MGVPVIGCTCPVCFSSSPYNKRLRPSALIKAGDSVFLIDAGPDFRAQALKYKIHRLDGLLLTHTHFDHSGGLDDLRVYYFLQKKKLPCLVSKETLEELKITYHYLMRPLEDKKTVTAQFDFNILEEDFGSLTFEGLPLKYVSYLQSGMKVNGYKIGNLAYISDIHTFTPEVISVVKGVEILIVSALRSASSSVHFSVEDAIQFSRAVGAEKTYFTHIAHDLDHEKTNALLPPGIQLSYDGLEIEIEL